MAWPPPQRRDCEHPGTPHKHGTLTAYRWDNCKCPECRGVVAAAWRRTSRAKAYGTYQGSKVDATGTRRRLQALAVLGWSPKAVAPRCGLAAAHLQTIRAGRTAQVTVETETTVRSVYDQLWDQRPPAGDRHQTGAATKTRMAAAAKGWLGPLSWDDDRMDDPDAAPSAGHPDEVVVDDVAIREVLTGRPVPLTKAERAEAIRVATEQQMSAERIGELIGCAPRTVVRYRSGTAA